MSKVAFTTNLCLNPSFQFGLQGYSALFGAELFLDSDRFLFGDQSCRITTPGLVAGEGCRTAAGLIPAAASCSVSLYVFGEGEISISATVDPGAVLSATFPVTLTQFWNRIIIDEIPCSPGELLYITIYTNTKQSCTLWISGIQIEPNSPCHPYCDGDQRGCLWVNPFEPSISTQEFQFPASATGIAVAAGDIVPALLLNEIVFADPAEGITQSFGNLIFTGVVNPVAAFNDFGIFELTDPDPAMTYSSWTNTGIATGTGSTYSQVWSSFYAPLDYIVSDGAYLWRRAAFGAVGFQFGSSGAGVTQSITDVSLGIFPITTGFSAPSAPNYHLPRDLKIIVKPDRLNFITNPSFETSIAGWSVVGTSTLATDATKTAGDIIEFDDLQYTAGTQSMKVTVNANGDGASISLPDLIIGETYIVSAYVQAGAGLENILLSCSGGEAGASDTGIPYGISGDYGDVPYGGVTGTNDLATGTWFRPSFTFTAAASTETLTIVATGAADVSYPTHFWVDAVMTELGEILSFYFDGSFGTNYFWETNGTANLSRSYYYDQFAVKQQAVLNVLNQHVPLGISFDTPQYAVPYSQ